VAVKTSQTLVMDESKRTD